MRCVGTVTKTWKEVTREDNKTNRSVREVCLWSKGTLLVLCKTSTRGVVGSGRNKQWAK